METKSLSFEKMEEIEGGWSWVSCLSGSMATITTGAVYYGGAWFGVVGMGGVLVGGCVLANVLNG